MIKEYNYKKEIGARLKLYRETLKLNQKEFASKLGIKQESLSRYESGNQSIPDEIKLKLSEDISIDWLITGKGEMFVNALTGGRSQSSNRHAPTNLENKLNIQSHEHFEVDATISNNSFYSKYLLEDSTDENSPKEVDLIKIDNIVAKEKETAILIPNILSRYKEKLFAVAIEGDDMIPTISKNAIVLCNENGFVGYGIYTIKINGVYSVKRISMKNTESYIMACDNKLYESLEVATNDERLEIIGLVRVAINIL